MNPTTHHLLRALTTIALGSSLCAQSPENAPPWWGVQDDVTVSIFWDFSGPAPFTPQVVAAPVWYNPAITQAVPNGPLVILPNLNGRTDVLALVGNGQPRSAALNITVDNDPHYNWVKVFWFQFDELEGASGSIVESLEKDLAKYKRSSMTTKKESLGSGWNRITVSAQLIPQPDDEGIDFSFTEAAFGTAAIDNLFVNSKCVKLDESDQDGDAMGEVDGFTVDLTAAIPGYEPIAAAVTEGPGPGFARTYWISAQSILPGNPQLMVRLNASGTATGVTPMPDLPGVAPNGYSDLAVESVSSGGLVTHTVYALVDLRGTPGGRVVLRALDASGTLVPALDKVLIGFPSSTTLPSQRFGLAFNRSGNAGLGTFVVTAPGTAPAPSLAFEFDRAGNLLRTMNNLPSGVVGAGYDHVFGNYYWFSNAPRPTPLGQLQVNGSEWSAYDGEPTGNTFFGNLQLPNGAGPRGGVASGFDVYRRSNGSFRACCVAQLLNRTVLYELKGPFRFGPSLLGTCDMRGLPMVGSNNFTLTLEGVPNATFASLYAGFARQLVPFSLAPFGLDESNVVITLDMNSTLQVPTTPGEFSFTLPTLPVGFSGVPMFFQWVVFDQTAPGGVAMSKAGKTIIY